MSWAVRWDDEAVGELLDLAGSDRQQVRRIRQGIGAFAKAGEGDVRKLQGRGDEWRLRVGDWRVFFTYDRGAQTLIILHVRRRNEATYR